MDFWTDIAMTVLLRLLKDKKAVKKWIPALAKLFLALREAADTDTDLQKAITSKDVRVIK